MTPWPRHRSALLSVLLAGCLLGAAAPAAAQSPLKQNLAFTEPFVWYLANRLAYRLEQLQAGLGAKLDEPTRAQFRSDYEVLFHHHLIACGGPLPQLAELFKFFDLDDAESRQPLAVLSHVGGMEAQIFGIVDPWSGRIAQRLLTEFQSGRWQILPACIDAGFARQNPAIAAAQKQP